MKMMPAILLLLCSQTIWSKEDTLMAIPSCSEEEINGNFVASRIFGFWNMDYALSQQAGNLYVEESTVMTEKYSRDDDVRLQFPLAHFEQDFSPDKSSCAYSAGSYVLGMTVQGSSFEQSLQFVIVSYQGNMLLAFKPQGRGSETKHRYQMVNLVPESDETQDRLYKSKGGEESAFVFKRVLGP